MEMTIRGVVVATEETADALEKARGAAFDIGGVSFSNIADGATWACALADRLAWFSDLCIDECVIISSSLERASSILLKFCNRVSHIGAVVPASSVSPRICISVS